MNILYRKQKEQVSYDNGVTWIDTGNYRVGDILENPSNCKSDDSKQCRWVELDASEGYYCDGTTKYTVQVEECTENGLIWTRTGNQQKGSVLIESNSCDCGYTEYKWNLIEGRYVCGTENFNKYGVEVYQIGCNGKWTNAEPYQERITEEPIECYSIDCGMKSNEIEVIYVKGDEEEGSGAYDNLNLSIGYNEGYYGDCICISGDLDIDENIYIGKAEDIFPCDVWRIFFEDDANTTSCNTTNTKIKRINKFIDTKYLKSYSGMFDGLDKLEYINFDSFNTENGVLFTQMFYGCSSLTDDVIQPVSNFNVSKAVSLSGMFSNCGGLTSLDLSNWNTENVCTFRYMFSGCINLRELNIDNFDFSNMNQPFTIENKETETGTYTEFHTGGLPFMFYGLKDCNIYLRNAQYDINTFFGRGTDCAGFSDNGGTWDISGAFNSVSNVILDMGESDTEITSFFKLVANSNDVKIINGKKVNNTENTLTCIFGGNTDENTLLINNVSKDISGNVACHIYTEDLTENLTTTYTMLSDNDKVYIDFPTTRNVTNMSYMYSNNSNTNLQTDIIDSTSNVTDMRYMFYNCRNVRKLDLSSFDTSNVTTMFNMFNGCNRLTSLDLSSFDTSNVTNMGQMFEGCYGLTSLDLSSFNTSNVTIMGYMFNYCTNLTSLDLSSFNTSNVTIMDYMFEGCSRLTSLDLSSFDTSNVTTMRYMFSGCQSLTELNLSSFDISNATYYDFVFENCDALTSLTVKYGTEDWWLARLKEVGLQDNVTITTV